MNKSAKASASAKQEMPTLQEVLTQPTADVPVAGKRLWNLGRQASYQAAKTGEMPTITVGGKIRALVKPMAERVGLTVKF